MTREEWKKGYEIRKQIREGNFIIGKLCTKRTVAVDYNWLEYVMYDKYNNPYSVDDYVKEMEEMLWSTVTLKGFYEPKTLTVKYMCYTGDGKYYLENKETLRR